TRDIFTVQDENDFESKVANSKVPVVIDFYANWCGPCKILTPRLETIIYEQQDKVNLAKIDVDANEDLAQRFQVTALPSVFAMKNGKVVDKFTGVRDDDEVRLFVEKLAN
ncbi:thioredoxin-like protein, partial [Dinothrombium tinctorium]